MAYGSCRFLFFQLRQRDKANEVIGDTDALLPFSAGLVRGLNIDGLYQLPQRVGRQLVQFRIPCAPTG